MLKSTMDNKLDTLEELISHQQITIDEMGQEIYTQQKEIQKLSKIVTYLKERLDGIDDVLHDIPSATQKPPHY